MKSAIVFALAIVPALTGLLEAAEPLDAPQVAAPLSEALPPEPAGPPIRLIVRIHELDVNKLGPDLDFRPSKDDRKTIHWQFEELRKSGSMRVLAEPHLVTQDGKTATCQSGGEVPVLVPAGKETVAIDWLEFGVRIEVTPRRVKQDRVQIKIAAEFTRRAEHGLQSEEGTTPVVVGRSIRTATTLGPKDIVVLNDREATVSDDHPDKVVFMTIELAQADVEAALLQFDGQAGEDLSAPPRAVPAREAREFGESVVEPPVTTAREPALDLPHPIETAGQPVNVSPVESGSFRPARKKVAASTAGSFFLKPGKTQLELTRGTWRSLTIPSKDFAAHCAGLERFRFRRSVLEGSQVSTADRNRSIVRRLDKQRRAVRKYAADIWTIKGAKPGIATIRLLDDDDHEYEIEVTVKGDTRHFDAMVKRFHPKAKVEGHELTRDSIVITGEATAEDSVAIREIAEQIYATVLLRLKTQPASEALLDGLFPGPVYKEEGASTNPDPGTDAKGETGSNAFFPTVTTGDSYADPKGLTPTNSRNDYGSGKRKNHHGSGKDKADVPAVDTGIAQYEEAGGDAENCHRRCSQGKSAARADNSGAVHPQRVHLDADRGRARWICQSQYVGLMANL